MTLPSDVFRVSIASLSDGLHQESFQPTAADLGLDPETFSNLDVDVRLDISGRRVLAQYDARGVARLECDRTLDMYDQPIEGSHAVLFVPPEAAPEADGDDDEVRLLADSDTHIDLTEPVRDTLVLAIPLRRVSPAAEALDIETSFGDDGEGTEDDRWAALRALSSKSDDDSA